MAKRSLLKKAVTLLAVCVLAGLSCLFLASCKEETVKKYDYLVTFDYNYGKINADCNNQYLGVKKNSLVGLKPGLDTNFKEQGVQGYYVEGWYTAKTDADGNPVKDETTGMIVVDEKWDFETMRVNSDITLYAKLIRFSRMSFIDAEAYALNPADEKAILEVKESKPDSERNRPSDATAPSKDGYTLFEYYKDADCKVPFEWPYKFTTEDVNVYVKFIKGKWKFVSTEEAFINALGGTDNIYLLSDLDFTGKTWQFKNVLGEINGNGHKISNITLKRETSRVNVGSGLFNELGTKAYVHDLTIENATIEFKVALAVGESKSGFFAYAALNGSRISNVTVSGTLYYDFGENKTASVSEWIANDKSVSENCDYSAVKTEDRTNN